MKFLCGVFFLAGAFAMSADYIDRVPEGHFAGTGSWRDNLGAEGSYQAYAEFSEDLVRLDYAWDQTNLTTQFRFNFISKGVFQVLNEYEIIGMGMCELNRCQFSIDFPEGHYRESLYYFQSLDGAPYLLKVGEKKVHDRVVKWREVLDKLESVVDSHR